MYYPDRHHPIFFLQDALTELGADAVYTNRDERTEGCYGLLVNGKPVVWLIDNRWMHERAKEDPAAHRLLIRGALVCCAQKPDATRIGAKWLPLAITPGYAPDPNIRKQWEVGFVGYVRDESRGAILKYLARYFSTKVCEGVFGDEAVRIYQGSLLGVNIPTNYGNSLAYDSANMRCFEILATGTPLITPFENYLVELGLLHGVNCYTYDNWQLIGDLVRGAVRTKAIANQVGINGMNLVFKRHTYTERAKQVLEWLK